MKLRTPLPDSIANAPLIRAGLEPYYVAFWELSSCRGVGMGAGPIPWTAIDRYASRCGHDSPDEFEDLVDFMRAMDDVWLRHQANEHKKREAARAARAAQKTALQKRGMGL